MLHRELNRDILASGDAWSRFGRAFPGRLIEGLIDAITGIIDPTSLSRRDIRVAAIKLVEEKKQPLTRENLEQARRDVKEADRERDRFTFTD